MQRRQFIMLGLATGALLATGVQVYSTNDSAENRAITATEQVLDALLPAILLGALSAEPERAQQQLMATRQAVCEFFPFLPKTQQDDIERLCKLLSYRLSRLALTGHLLGLEQLSLSQRLALLARWRDSYLAVLQQAYHGLRALIMGAFYGQPSQWAALNYQALEFRAYE